MTTDRVTGDVAGSWKGWLLLAGVSATVFGWLALSPHDEPPMVTAAPNQIAARPAPGTTHRATRTADGVGPVRPARPVFQAPITRTRRS